MIDKIIDEVRKDRDKVLNELSIRGIEENARTSRSITMAKAEALEIAEREAVGRRTAETAFRRCEEKLIETQSFVQTLQEERETICNDRSQLQREVDSLSDAIELFKTQNLSMKVKQEELFTDLITRNASIEELHRRIDHVNSISDGLEKDKRAFQDKAEEAQNRSAVLELELEEARFQLVSLAKLYEYQESVLEKSQKENEDSKSKCVIVTQKFQDKMAHLQRMNTQLQERNQSLETHLHKLQDESVRRKPTGPISYLNSMHDTALLRTKHK